MSPYKFNGKVAHSAAVNSNLKAGYHGHVLSELCLVGAFPPHQCSLSEKLCFKVNRAGSHRRRTQTGDLVCVKVVQRYSRSRATLNALSHVSFILKLTVVDVDPA